MNKRIELIQKELDLLRKHINELSKEKSAESGIICPSCGMLDSKIINTRYRNNTQEKRRKCLSYGMKWTTMEVMKPKQRAR